MHTLKPEILPVHVQCVLWKKGSDVHVQHCALCNSEQCSGGLSHTLTGWFFFTGPAQKVLSMELVQPKKRK